ncbi:MAG: polysaccharide deacetylase family protein [Polyangia bacterium]
MAMTSSPADVRVCCTFVLGLAVALVPCVGCRSDEGGGALGNGGNVEGGAPSVGNGGTGGAAAAGGVTGIGGSMARGDAGAGGGSQGGNAAAGGRAGLGGTVGVGGTSGGGVSTRGGTTGLGGSPVGVGGSAASAGATGGGGTASAGATGGGGTASAGATGGENTGAAGGGSAGAAGTNVSNSPSGYPMPPGSGSEPAPSGSPGTLTVLNWAGFKGAVTYTFDDDNDSQIANYSSLEGLGVPLTFYLWTGRTEATNSVWGQAVKDGHGIGNHTQSHESSPPGGVADINAATQFIEQNLKVTPYTMAAPNGAAVYTSLAPTAGMMINRGVADAIIKPNDNTDRYTLPCYIPPTGATASTDFNPEVDAAESAGGWRVILVHGFTGGNDGAYQPVPLSEFLNGVSHAKSLGDMWIGRLEDVGSYWLGQKAIASATKTTSGNSTTWSWTLPSNFAPGKYVRITVSGGTVTQKGSTMPWNPQGFYEISLDAGTVSVGP